MTTKTGISHEHHRRAVRFFWTLLIGATVVSLVGNVTRALLRYIPFVVIQIGAAAVPPIALLAAVHGIALAVRAGASGRVYCWAVGAVGAIGIGAFAVSFLALRDLMRAIGYGPTTACIFPLIIDTAVAVGTAMLVALGDRPARRTRTAKASTTASSPTSQRLPLLPRQGTKDQLTRPTATSTREPGSAPEHRHPGYTAQGSARYTANQIDLDVAQADADLASELIASGTTTQPVETVVAVLVSRRGGASINAAAKASGINYRTAQRIVEAAAEDRQRQLAAVG